MNPVDRRLVLLLVGVLAALLFAIPVMGADPSPSANPSAEVESDEPDTGESEAEKAEEEAEAAAAKAESKADQAPEIAVTLIGTVVKTADGKGRPTFTLTVGGVTWELSAGPKWYWGDKNPLVAFVGKSVKVTGTHHEGETELDVETVDGTALRAAGKPPWAGGPKLQGERHPGWKAWKADKANGKPGKGHGREGAPGQLKDKSASD
jgi:hypothetical protein